MVKRLLCLALLLSAPAMAQQTAIGTYALDGSDASAVPSGCVATSVMFFGTPVTVGPTCDTGYTYTASTDTLAVPGTVSTRNVTATALATPVITPPISNVLTKLTTVTVVAGASLVDGDYFTLSDGSAVVYEFTTDGTYTAGRVPVAFVGTENAQGIRDLVVVAINGSTLAAQAIAAAADTLTVTLDVAGAAGGGNSENVANAGFLVPVWGDPTHATTYGYVAEACLADGTCAPSAEVTTATGHATLDNHNFNTVTWGAVPGVSYYKLKRKTGTPSGGDAPPRLLYTGTALTFSDTNATSTSEAVVTSNGTGILTGGGMSLDGGSAVYDPATDTLGLANGGVVKWGTDLSLVRRAANELKIADGGTGFAFMFTGGYRIAFSGADAQWAAGYYSLGTRMASGWHLTWNSATDFNTGADDFGLKRNSAGVGKVTDGGAGLGALLMSIPSYADNAAAFAALGAGRLYYTDTGGEYIVKVSH